MKQEHKAVVRCAIYTRKSSEEGLEQSFNSLHAQREACEAFVISQRHEGWIVIRTAYDDGGYSGGTLERPALTQLLNDVRKGDIDTIVVYKVDRLTRSLTDFAKIIENLDSNGVSFVSVTQQFNTTSSMGRLTLNVLLSFAQFEREVTGERIRDKISASKKKGMWMGGHVPLGYDLRNRLLIPNPGETALVRRIFNLYLQLGCVSSLKKNLDKEGLKTKVWTSRSGTRIGGNFFSRGALYELLRNRLYVGEIRHRVIWYPGQHDGIVPRDVWDKVQALMTSNHHDRRAGIGSKSESLLCGMIYDFQGNRFTPSHTVKNGRRYRYYVCQSVIRNPGGRSPRSARIPAHEIDKLVTERVRSFLSSQKDVLDLLSVSDDSPALTHELLASAERMSTQWPSMSPNELHKLIRRVVRRVVVQESGLDLQLNQGILRRIVLAEECPPGKELEDPPNNRTIHLRLGATVRRSGMEVRLVIPAGMVPQQTHSQVPALLKAIARAHEWYGWVLDGKTKNQASIARRAGLNERYVAKVFRCAFLAPDIVQAILDGHQPRELTFAKLCRKLPLSWADQRKQLGFLV